MVSSTRKLLLQSFIYSRTACLSFLLICCLSTLSWSQQSRVSSHAARAEKIYLQLDSKVYTTDKIIWFKAIVSNAIDHSPTVFSGVLYAELVGPAERVVEKKIIKIEKGTGSGFFELNSTYDEGLYLVRAYTEWNKNFGTDFVYEEYINVFDSEVSKKQEAISDITILEKQDGKRELSVSLNPYAIDSLHKSKLNIYISQDEKKDSISIKKNGDKKYMLQYDISPDCQFLTLQIETRNRFSYSKTIAINEDYLDVQFFPESGELVHGLPSKVGIKSLDYNGKGIAIRGEIVDENGKLITPFKTNKLGMGNFSLIGVDSSKTYYASVTLNKENSVAKKYPLPKATSRGNVLSVIKYRDRIALKASSNYLKNDSIFLRVTCRGLVCFDVKSQLKEGVRSFALLANTLPEGIIAFTLMDPSKQPIAERLYFNERLENRINIGIATSKDEYKQREMTKLDITSTDIDGKESSANLSLLVLNKKQMGETQSIRENILSYFLLSSDLKGKIENPGFYFKNETVNHRDIDNLLLTQGWRRYLYKKPVQNITFLPEPGITVSGYVGGALAQKKRKAGVNLTMMTFGETRTIQTQKTDSLGKFSFGLADQYGKNVNVMIQSTGKSGKKKGYTVSLSGKPSPKVVFDHIKSIESVDSVLQELVAKNRERKAVEDAFSLSADVYLEEFTVSGYKLTPERKKVNEAYGEPDKFISGDDILKEKKKLDGLYNILLSSFSDQLFIETTDTTFFTAKVIGSRGPTLIVVDGIPVIEYDYHLVPDIPASQVTSVEIIEGADNFAALYSDVHPDSTENIPTAGSVIAVYTQAGIGISGTQRPKGIMYAFIPAFSTPKEFYAPKHENLQANDWVKPDLRALVHWQPEIITDNQGKASTSFYNADNIGEMLVVVEAISSKGEIGYQEFVYNVEKRER